MVEVFQLGVHDPKAVVTAGDAYSLKDYEGDRKNQGECLAELARRLNVRRMMVMPMNENQVVSNVSNYLKNFAIQPVH